jgi:threonyl-tRNA synthetase
MKEMSPLEEIRHSTAHILATAVLRLYPETKLDIGPPTDSGFYYDFDSEISFTPEILWKLSRKWPRLLKKIKDLNEWKYPVKRPRKSFVKWIKRNTNWDGSPTSRRRNYFLLSKRGIYGLMCRLTCFLYEKN